MLAILYDLFCAIFSFALSIFFREIRARGRQNVPEKGPVIFVAAPHHNQFVDPLVLMKTNSRRISFLAAEVSMRRRVFGPLIRAFGSIGVQRLQDLAVASNIRLAPVHDTSVIKHDRFRIIYDTPLEAESLQQKLLPGSYIFLSGVKSSDPLQVLEVIKDFNLVRVANPIQDKELLIRMRALPNGVKIKIAPPRKSGGDADKMYNCVFEHLSNNGCIGIFPEGGSHDRSEMLPFKPGFAIMALSAMARTPHLDVKIVPVGLSYFNAHRFRSRAVVEYGMPVSVPQRLVAQYAAGGLARRSACQALLEVVHTAVRNVTVTAPDYSTLMVAQAVRRLYHPINKRLTLVQKLEFTRLLVRAYLKRKDEPRYQELEARVLAYNKQLEYHGLQDHQVERTATVGIRALALLLYRVPMLFLMALIALPGTILTLPIALASDHISKKKAREALAASSVKIAGLDVLATWKVLVAVVLAPIVHLVYVVLSYLLVTYYLQLPPPWPVTVPLLVALVLPYISLIAISFGEVGADIYKSLAPLTYSILPTRWGVSQNLRRMRALLAEELNQMMNELGPTVFPDFKRHFLEDTVIQSSEQNAAGLSLVSSWVSNWLVPDDLSESLTANESALNKDELESPWTNSFDLTRYFLPSSSSFSNLLSPPSNASLKSENSYNYQHDAAQLIKDISEEDETFESPNVATAQSSAIANGAGADSELRSRNFT